jgi:heme-degrading monooxygenase HmoA
MMELATFYEQWAAAGNLLDRCEGNETWKMTEKSKDYDVFIYIIKQ